MRAFHMSEEDIRKQAVTWACLTAKGWGWTWELEGSAKNPAVIVNTGENVIECRDFADFVSFVADANKVRHARP